MGSWTSHALDDNNEDLFTSISDGAHDPIYIENDIKDDLPVDEDEDPDAHCNYFWGEMTAEEADVKLEDARPGTFLVRKNCDQFILSWKARNNTGIWHGTIESVDGNFQFRTSHHTFTFKSIHQMTIYFQLFPKDKRLGMALGSPLLKDPAVSISKANMIMLEN